MGADREIDLLPSKIVGRRREPAPRVSDAAAWLETVWSLRGPRGLAPRGLFRFTTFEEAEAWLTHQMSLRSGLRPSTTSAASAELSTAPERTTS